MDLEEMSLARTTSRLLSTTEAACNVKCDVWSSDMQRSQVKDEGKREGEVHCVEREGLRRCTLSFVQFGAEGVHGLALKHFPGIEDRGFGTWNTFSVTSHFGHAQGRFFVSNPAFPKIQFSSFICFLLSSPYLWNYKRCHGSRGMLCSKEVTHLSSSDSELDDDQEAETERVRTSSAPGALSQLKSDFKEETHKKQSKCFFLLSPSTCFYMISPFSSVCSGQPCASKFSPSLAPLVISSRCRGIGSQIEAQDHKRWKQYSTVVIYRTLVNENSAFRQDDCSLWRWGTERLHKTIIRAYVYMYIHIYGCIDILYTT